MCEVNFDDFDSASAWSESKPRARKPHRCDGCGCNWTREVRSFEDTQIAVTQQRLGVAIADSSPL